MITKVNDHTKNLVLINIDVYCILISNKLINESINLGALPFFSSDTVSISAFDFRTLTTISNSHVFSYQSRMLREFY